MKGKNIMSEEKMKIEQLTFPDEFHYHPEHTWVKVKSEEVFIGISDFAQDQLGEIVYVDLPNVGDSLAGGEIFGIVESAKSASSLYLPISGEILAVNANVVDSPELVNQDPYGEGWMIALKVQDSAEIRNLMSKEEYVNYLKDTQDP
ncbi:glycine cleavage system protein GcvH [Desulfitobacterium sp. AusDCA]